MLPHRVTQGNISTENLSSPAESKTSPTEAKLLKKYSPEFNLALSDGHSSGSDTEKLPEADQQIVGCGDGSSGQKSAMSSLEQSIKDQLVFEERSFDDDGDDDEVPVNYAQVNYDQGNQA